MDPEPAKGDPHTHLWSAERVEALSRNLVVPEIDSPKWAGISPQDADNLSFACTAQLLTEYLNCLNFGVSASTIKAWHNHSYQGETSEDGMPNGHGTVQLFGGLAYTGAFTGGLLHGEGTLHWGDGLLSYTGEFFYNSIHGRGTYQWPGRASYTGQVFEGLPHGGGCMYTGEDDFCSYEGFWQHGLRHGQGKLVYGKEGKYVYEGHWDKDRKNGEGHMTYGSGSKYNGHWLEGKRHGKGHLVLMTPQTYTKNTVASLGRLDSTRVHIYEGDWISDLPHGMGQSLWAWGENEAATNHLLNKYIGEYNKGTRHGQGAFYYASGAMYKGEWKHNAKDGKGVFIYEDGHVHCGIFNFDRYDLNILPSYTFLEPMDVLFRDEDDPKSLKQKVSNIILRHINKIKAIYNMYSCISRTTPKEYKPYFYGQDRAMYLEQFWHFCHDSNVLVFSLLVSQAFKL